MRLTSNQQAVLATLKEARGPLGAYALLDRLRSHGFSAPTQVYRALDRLQSCGLVHRLSTLNAYVCCACTATCRHDLRAFAICDECGSVSELADSDLSGCLDRWVKGNAFSLRGAAIELLGRCAGCGDSGSAANEGGKFRHSSRKENQDEH
ncbi:Fur family transcriptional regulator [Chitinasiproducens palmae]|uniref:Fur family transcriptional regulator, zinc uptake regulator n=1 Tax=Chitinasiproducens palmae TaxID=1770053 RepID=A0A1H2PJD5_9BURK|nr:Fur family transcriptional regulator [Chitinasiproducens palmae]SDV46438.1 Fur family transcriptional regulator, zinc uptake regulator [Chitinasiproducens palmae]